MIINLLSGINTIVFEISVSSVEFASFKRGEKKTPYPDIPFEQAYKDNPSDVYEPWNSKCHKRIRSDDFAQVDHANHFELRHIICPK